VRRAAIAAAIVVGSIGVSGPAGAATHLRQFQTPSGNIGCVLSNRFGTEARCDIGNRDWKTPKKPASCDLDYGNGVFIGARGRAHFLCAGDTALHAGPKIAYGRTVRLTPFACKVSTTGVRCTNAHGHGFSISRQSYRFF
jgi:hypothetical protein